VIGVQSHDPSKGDLADLAKLVRNSQVISIDTALAHLCAAMGYPATILLPVFADERWVELHKPNNSYGRWLRLERNIHFGDWRLSLDRLLGILLNS
jgi:ADP-heptose:LPS heptosyltransferase